MKKFFALVLAVAMIMSMAAVSFAADKAVVYGPFDYDADTNNLRTTGIQYGDTVLFLLAEEGYTLEITKAEYDKITDAAEKALWVAQGTGRNVTYTKEVGPAAMTDYNQVEKLKLKVSYELGEDMVESISVVKKYVEKLGNTKTTESKETYYSNGYVGNDAAAALGAAAAGTVTVDSTNYDAPDANFEGGYYYFIAMKVKKSQSVGDVDIIGTFELNRKENDDKGVAEIDEFEHDFAVNVAINNGWLKDAANYVIEDDKEHLKWDTDYALKFNYDDEVELSFGMEDNEGTFTVDVSGQGKLYLRYDTKLADAIAEANPGVKIVAVNFNGVKFNRVGEFAYEMEDGVACYKVVDGALVAIPGAEYDDSDETFYFNTRVLENYVFASAELVNPVVEAPVVEAPVATNPSTGA